jgi:hypothetical protein
MAYFYQDVCLALCHLVHHSAIYTFGVPIPACGTGVLVQPILLEQKAPVTGNNNKKNYFSPWNVIKKGVSDANNDIGIENHCTKSSTEGQ